MLDTRTILYVCVTDSDTALAIEKRLQQEQGVDRFSLFAAGDGDGNGGTETLDSLSDSEPLVTWRGKMFGDVSTEYKTALADFTASLGDSTSRTVVNEYNPVPVVGFGSTFGSWVVGETEKR